MITIRKATPNDIPQLEILFQVSRQHTFVSRHPDEFQIGDYQKSTAEDEVWVAEEHGSIVGFVSTYPADNFIHNLFVHPEHQAKHIGTQLLHIAEANLGRPMTLKIAMDNLKPCGFYEKHGWYKVSQHDDASEPCLLYKKDCTPVFSKNIDSDQRKYKLKGDFVNELDAQYELSVATDDECEQVSNEIMWFNARQVPFTTKPTPVFKRYVIKDKSLVIAGINAFVYHWGMLFIDELFVSETYRNKNLASYLMRKVENEAKLIGATLAHTDTFDFQAKDFYLKHGYEVFGVLDDCPKGHKRYYMKKVLEE